MKRKKRWIVMMSLMVLLSIWGVLTPESPELWMPDQYFDAANVAWMITATIFVLMMTPGLSFFYGGMVGRKNIISTILQSFIAMGVISVICYLVFLALFSIFVYCPLAHWTWHPDGFLRQMGVLDFAGGIVVHASSGVAALTGALFLGRRKNVATPHVPANIPFVVLGAAMLWLGWFGFNAGSSLAADGIAVKAFLNTNTASATAMMTWLFFDCLRGRKPSAMGAAVGAVVGLVAITPSAGYVTVGESIMIAFLTTLVCNIAVYWKNKTHVDDALDVFPTHGVGGIFGTILTGVFVHGLLDGNIHMFLIHLLAVVIVCGYTFVVSYILYWLTNKMIPMRVSPESEAAGLDKSQHDECYGNG
jgi:Amt family ammonium transporter